MPNYYILFSETIENVTPEEGRWLTKILSIDPDDMIEEEWEKWADDGIDGVKAQIDPEYWPEFCWEYDPDRKELWIYSEESGEVENVISVIQRFLEKFRPNDSWSMSCAFTCSRPIAGSFGGGAVYITSTEVRSMSTDGWINEQEKIPSVQQST